MASHPKPAENTQEDAVHAMMENSIKSILLYHITLFVASFQKLNFTET